jgi:hypothetical protein
MQYTEIETKLLRHALDTNSEGESGNAAVMFFKALRKRGLKAHQFLDGLSAVPRRIDDHTYEDLKRVKDFVCEQNRELLLRNTILMARLGDAERKLEILSRRDTSLFGKLLGRQ